MTDAALVRKKLAFIETCLEDIGRLSHPGAFRTDLREQRFVMAGFRNVVVHLYDDIDLDVVARILEYDLHDLRQFVEVVRGTL